MNTIDRFRSTQRVINEALEFADRQTGPGRKSHYLKVLALAVRHSREAGDPQALPVSPAYTAMITQELLEACRAQHNALDILMAHLIILTQRHTPEEQFYPSQSGLPWEAMTRAAAVIEKANGP